MKKYNGIFVAGLVVLSGCQSHVGSSNPPHVTDNKILTDIYCQSINAGYASKLYNTKDMLSNKIIQNVETCSKWVTLQKDLSQNTKQSKLVASNNPYNFDQNTVLAWGQSGANNLMLTGYGNNGESTTYGINSTPISSGTGYGGLAQVGTLVEVNDNPIVPVGVGSSGYYYPGNYLTPFFPELPYYPTNFINFGYASSYYNISMPRICNDDSRYNVSGSVSLLLYIGGTPISYPVAYVTYCSWNGTTEDNFDSYSTAIQTFGGITQSEIFTTGNLSNCTYSTTNAGSANSNTSMNCNINGNNVTFSLTEQFSNLRATSAALSDLIKSPVCYGSGGLSNNCAQNGWNLEVSYPLLL